MSLTTPSSSATRGVRRYAYWCEALAHTPEDGRTFALGGRPASTPRLAVRWLHSRTHEIADQLDPPLAYHVRHWLAHLPEHERALALLRQGEPYVFAFQDDHAHYQVSAQPAVASDGY